VLAAFPELIRRAVVMAVSAPGAECQEPARPQASSPLLPLVVLSTPRTAREGSGRERLRLYRLPLGVLDLRRLPRRAALFGTIQPAAYEGLGFENRLLRCLRFRNA
jgi:hypothetical protein